MLKRVFSELLQGKFVERRIDEYIAFPDLSKNEQVLWALLLNTGYLKPVKTTIEMGEYLCPLAIPNFEVTTLYKNMVENWFDTEGVRD